MTYKLVDHVLGDNFVSLADGYIAVAETAKGFERQDALQKAARALKNGKKLIRLSAEVKVRSTVTSASLNWLQGDSSSALHGWQHAIELASEIGAKYEIGICKLTMGRFSKNVDAVKNAQEIFASIGAEGDLARANEVFQ
jgi:sugar phosphate isomerase/epimerase